MTTNEYSHWLKANRRSLDNRANKKKNDIKKSQELLNTDDRELRENNKKNKKLRSSQNKLCHSKSKSKSKINIFEKVYY